MFKFISSESVTPVCILEPESNQDTNIIRQFKKDCDHNRIAMEDIEQLKLHNGLPDQLEIYVGLLVKYPFSIYLRNGYALELQNQKKFEAAKKEYNLIISVFPNYYSLMCYANLLRKLGEFSEAKEMYVSALGSTKSEDDKKQALKGINLINKQVS